MELRKSDVIEIWEHLSSSMRSDLRERLLRPSGCRGELCIRDYVRGIGYIRAYNVVCSCYGGDLSHIRDSKDMCSVLRFGVRYYLKYGLRKFSSISKSRLLELRKSRDYVFMRIPRGLRCMFICDDVGCVNLFGAECDSGGGIKDYYGYVLDFGEFFAFRGERFVFDCVLGFDRLFNAEHRLWLLSKLGTYGLDLRSDYFCLRALIGYGLDLRASLEVQYGFKSFFGFNLLCLYVVFPMLYGGVDYRLLQLSRVITDRDFLVKGCGLCSLVNCDDIVYSVDVCSDIKLEMMLESGSKVYVGALGSSYDSIRKY